MRNNILYFLLALIASYLIFPSNLYNFLYPLQESENHVWMSLDPSWQLTLNYAYLNNMEWGKDFVFTFGPLGFLSTKFLWGVNKYLVLFFDVFLIFNLFLIFKKTIQNSEKKILTVVFILITSIVLPNYLGSSVALILLIILLFWIHLSFEKPTIFNYSLQIVLLTLLFYIKVNTGIVAIFFYLTGVSYNFISKQIDLKRFILYLIVPFIGIIYLAYLLNVNLINYFINSLELISGYNQVMYLDIKENQIFYFLSLPFLIYLLLLMFLELKENYKTKKQLLRVLLIFMNYGAIWYILFKQSFVRGDFSHIKEFFISSTLFAIVVLFFYLNKYFKITVLFTSVIFLVNIYVLNENLSNMNYFDKINKANYVTSFLDYSKTESIKIIPNDNSFPQQILSKIGTSTVDSYPWNSYSLLENKLNFIPRPVFQSYTTYTKELQDLNFDFYNSDKAPEYVIYDIAAIDERYSLFDDSRLNLILSKKYEFEDEFDYKNRKLLLLKRKSKKTSVELVQTKEYAIILGDPFIPKKDTYYELQCYPNILGKAYTFLLHAPESKLIIKTKDGSTQTFRTSKDLLESGFFSNYFISETKDFKKLLTEQKTDREIKYYKIEANKMFFKDKIRVKEFQIKVLGNE